jgi:hypothetical protein
MAYKGWHSSLEVGDFTPIVKYTPYAFVKFSDSGGGNKGL